MKWHRRDRRARKSKRKTLFILFLVVKVKVLYSKSTDLLIMGLGWS
jgi:hypothetical protein